MNTTRLILGIAITLLIMCPSLYGQTKIATVEELSAINDSKTSLAGDYVLMSDLTLNNWTPIGGLDNKEGEFSGTFDGNGHTITITGFNNSSDNSRIGLFGSIEQKGVVKNLCVAGNFSYTSGWKFLYIGGVAGVNYGHIICCASKIALEGTINSGQKKQGKVQSIFGYEDGTFGGCIVGINLGVVDNCYSTGSILVSGDKFKNCAGGITGGNGVLSINPGTVKVYNSILHCYSTASVIAKGDVTYIVSGGIAALNNTNGVIMKCVSLNKIIEAHGAKRTRLFAMPVATFGYTNYRNPDVFYREDIIIRKYKNGDEQKQEKFSEKNAVVFSTTQEQSWWRYPDGLSENDKNQKFGFSFGDNEQSPWAWNNEEKHPVLYWE